MTKLRTTVVINPNQMFSVSRRIKGTNENKDIWLNANILNL